MDTPMVFALVNNTGIVTNIIWLRASERAEFPNSVCSEDRPVLIGDQYADGEFYRDGVIVPRNADTVKELTTALAIIEEAING